MNSTDVSICSGVRSPPGCGKLASVSCDFRWSNMACAPAAQQEPYRHSPSASVPDGADALRRTLQGTPNMF